MAITDRPGKCHFRSSFRDCCSGVRGRDATRGGFKCTDDRVTRARENAEIDRRNPLRLAFRISACLSPTQ